MPLGLTTPSIHCVKPLHNKRKYVRYSSGVSAFSMGWGCTVAITAALSYSSRPGQTKVRFQLKKSFDTKKQRESVRAYKIRGMD